MSEVTTTTRTRTGVPIRERLLQAGLEEFARHGYAAASLRRLTAAAGVSLGNVRRIFGSKHELLGAVHEHYVGPMQVKRLELLDALEYHKPNPSIVDVFDAQAEPLVEFLTHEDGVLRGQFTNHGLTEHDAYWPVVRRFVEPLRDRFYSACIRALSDLDPDEVRLRWKGAVRLFEVGITPNIQNVDVPEPVSLADAASFRRLAITILTSPIDESAIPRPPWERRRAKR